MLRQKSETHLLLAWEPNNHDVTSMGDPGKGPWLASSGQVPWAHSSEGKEDLSPAITRNTLSRLGSSRREPSVADIHTGLMRT